MEILWLAFAISVPIFYIWGFFAFIQKFFDKKDDASHPPDSSSRENERLEFIAYLYRQAEESPDMPLSEFLEEAREQRRQLISERITPSDTSVSDIESPPLIEDEPTQIGNLLSEPEPVQSFSWNEWYSDHTIDFILYLGAFMIVAAVSLFVGIQWENFDGITRFGIVLAFTMSWFVAGIAVQRFLSLESVTIAFMTIGAIITPFCGLAFQRFVIGSMDNVGMTWLITSAIGTLIYLVLSLFYQRRHFTYFGNLSILATILSLVEVTASPAEYYVLAGAVSAIILLIARIAVKFLAPHLDDYLGQDVENSSLAILAFSVIAGSILIPLTSLPFFSIEVLAVMLAVLIFSCIYLLLRFDGYTVVIAQVLAVLTFSHALLTFNVDDTIALYTVLIASLLAQFILNRLLSERFPEIYSASNIAGFLVSGFAYLLSIGIAEGGFLAIPALVLLIGHAVFYANYFEKTLWYLVSILTYPLLAHILYGLEIDISYWIPAYVLLAVVQLLVLRFPVDKIIRSAFVYPALIVAGFAGVTSLSVLMSYPPLEGLAYWLNLLSPYAVLIAYAIVILTEDTDDEDSIFKEFPVPVILAGVSVIYFLMSTPLEPALIPLSLALSVSVMFWLAYRSTGIPQLFYIILAAPYAALYFALIYLDAPFEIYPVAVAILSLITYFALFLPEDSDMPRQVVAILATGAVSFFAFNQAMFDETMTMHFAGWVSAYSCLFMLWNSRSLIGGEAGDAVFSAVVYLQYCWHIIFLQSHVDAVLFENPQWYSAALASVLLINMLNVMRRNPDSEFVFPLHLGFVAVLMLPTLGQILYEQPLLYIGLGVSYSLLIAGIGLTFRRTSLQSQLVTLLAPVAVSLVVFNQAILNESMTMHFAGWVSAYAALFLLWNLRKLIGEDAGDAVISVAVYLQYVWHIIFLQLHVNGAIFSDPQWYSAALATGLLINLVKMIRRNPDSEFVFPLQLIAVAILMLPTLTQILYEQSLLYFGLGVAYSLIIAAIAITGSQTRMRSMATISLVLVVLSQSREFLLDLPRWLIVGIIGFGLLGAGLYLSIRRRNAKEIA